MKDNNQYGLPKLRKYPMPDKKHVKSAIRFFNYVSPTNEKELAKAILKRMRKYGMSFSDFTVGEENRFIKYVPKKYLSHNEERNMYSNNDFRYYKGGEYLAHYGVVGMHWGIRRYQPYGEGGYNPKSPKKLIKNAKAKIKNKMDEHHNSPKQVRKREAIRDKKNRYNMSDADLDKKINRIKKERELKDLTEQNYEPGKNFVKSVFGTSSKNAAIKLATGFAVGAGALWAKNKFGITIPVKK